MLLGDERAALCEIGRKMVASGLVTGASGNISVRAGGLVAVTPGGMMLDRMRPEDCVVVDLGGQGLGGQDLGGQGGLTVDGTRAPSSETPMHLAVYQASDATAIVHTHSTYAAVVATTMTELPPVHYNTLALGGVVQVAEYATYGTGELARNVRQALKGGRWGPMYAALMANHGGVALGRGLEHAYENAVLLEWLCQVYVQARMIGEPRVLSEDELQRVVERGLVPPGHRVTG